jgi:16S rRNA (cytidine1402-2'-O)-methyltransferase
LISDPGYKLVRECIAQGIEIDSLPGPSSVITALTLSGLPPDKFLFLGYPPEKMGKRTKWLEKFKNIDATIIILAPPHKLLRNLDSIKNVCGDIEVVLAHELTKIHQSVETRKISEWLDKLKNLKGEYILMFRLHPN